MHVWISSPFLSQTSALTTPKNRSKNATLVTSIFPEKMAVTEINCSAGEEQGTSVIMISAKNESSFVSLLSTPPSTF